MLSVSFLPPNVRFGPPLSVVVVTPFSVTFPFALSVSKSTFVSADAFGSRFGTGAGGGCGEMGKQEVGEQCRVQDNEDATAHHARLCGCRIRLLLLS